MVRFVRKSAMLAGSLLLASRCHWLYDQFAFAAMLKESGSQASILTLINAVFFLVLPCLLLFVWKYDADPNIDLQGRRVAIALCLAVSVFLVLPAALGLSESLRLEFANVQIQWFSEMPLADQLMKLIHRPDIEDAFWQVLYLTSIIFFAGFLGLLSRLQGTQPEQTGWKLSGISRFPTVALILEVIAAAIGVAKLAYFAVSYKPPQGILGSLEANSKASLIMGASFDLIPTVCGAGTAWILHRSYKSIQKNWRGIEISV